MMPMMMPMVITLRSSSAKRPTSRSDFSPPATSLRVHHYLTSPSGPEVKVKRNLQGERGVIFCYIEHWLIFIQRNINLSHLDLTTSWHIDYRSIDFKY